MSTPKSVAKKRARSARTAHNAAAPDGAEGYSAHRERQRRRLLAAAEALFAAEGIERVSMLQITNAAGVQPSTLYQYFRSKEEIVWAITEEIFQAAGDRLRGRLEQRKTALQRLEAVLEHMAEELEERTQNVRFMAQFDVLYARELPVATLLRLETQMGFASFAHLRRWANEGIADRSLRPDLDPTIALHALLNTAIGTQRRLATLGDKVEQEYGQPVGKLFRETVRLLLRGVSAPARRRGPAAAKHAAAKQVQTDTKSRRRDAR